jgi:hypothetical protein
VFQAVPEFICHYAEFLHPGYRVLDYHHPLLREVLVERLLCGSKVWCLRSALSLTAGPPLERYGTLQVWEVFLPDTVVSSVEILLHFLREVGMSLAVDVEVMSPPPSSVVCPVDYQALRVDRQLRLDRMLPLLSRVVGLPLLRVLLSLGEGSPVLWSR